MKNTSTWVSLVALVFVLGTFGLVMAQHQNEVKKEAARMAWEAQRNQEFEEVLNGFLKKLDQAGREYKRERRLVSELVKPANLTEPHYVQENAEMMETMLPGLKTKMDAVMQVFDDAQKDMNVLLHEKYREPGAAESWNKLEEEQMTRYKAFFVSEQEILKAHQELMQYYKDRIGKFHYDEASDEMIFSTADEKRGETLLRNKIAEYQAMQAQMLKGPEKPE